MSYYQDERDWKILRIQIILIMTVILSLFFAAGYYLASDNTEELPIIETTNIKDIK